MGRSGIRAALVTDAQVANASGLTRSAYGALVVTDGATFPLSARANLTSYLHDGGDIVVIGGPLFERSRAEAQRVWRAELQRAAVSGEFADFATKRMTDWQHASSNGDSADRWSVESGGPHGAPALRFEIGDLRNWDVLTRPIRRPTPAPAAVVIFDAKGDSATGAMALEFQERDGSRWIATVPLAQEWRHYALPAGDFHFWEDGSPRDRGGPGDRLHLENAARISIGIAMSHAHVATGRHVFWMSSVGYGTSPGGAREPNLSLPEIETLLPWYKTYRLPSLHPTMRALRQPAETGDQTGPIVVPIPRPRGLGFAGDRPGRWIPLDDIRDDMGAWRGTSQSLYVNLAGPYRGAIIGQIAGADTQDKLFAAVVSMVHRMADGVFLEKAGADYFGYFQGGTARLGARVVNLSQAPRVVTVRLAAARTPNGRQWAALTRSVTLQPGTARDITTSASLPNAPGRSMVSCSVRIGGREVDRIGQQITVLSNAHAPATAFVRVRGGDFYARGRDGRPRKWYPYGVNYWQSNLAGADVRDYTHHWLAPGYYDPQIVERDLARLQSFGFTTISVQLNAPEQVWQAIDVIQRAADHGVRVNLFIAGAHPFQQDLPLMRRLLRDGRFANNPNVWAYDLAWEHHLGAHDERAGWDADWLRWVIQRYGTVEHAEKA